MKAKYFLTIFVVLVFSLIFSSFVPKLIFGNKNLQQIETVPVITDFFPKPSKVYFNSHSIDPTPYIKISNGNNTAPFTPPKS